MSRPRPRGRPSLRASLGAVYALLRICSPTIVEASLGKLTRESIDRRMRWWGEALRRYADADFQVEGLEHLETDETFVMMSNHESNYDVPMIYRAVPRTIRMVTKKELFRIPIWGRALRESGFFGQLCMFAAFVLYPCRKFGGGCGPLGVVAFARQFLAYARVFQGFDAGVVERLDGLAVGACRRKQPEPERLVEALYTLFGDGRHVRQQRQQGREGR